MLDALDRGANANKKDENCEAATIWAPNSGNVKIVKVLLEKRAEPNVTTRDGKWSA